MDDEDKDPRRVGRDEMNLAEFPIALLTDYPPEGVKMLVFEDRHGKLTVVGSEDLRRVGRDEMNLCEFPIALLTVSSPAATYFESRTRGSLLTEVYYPFMVMPWGPALDF